MAGDRCAKPPLWRSELTWPRLWTLIGVALVMVVTIASLMRVPGPLESLMSRDKLVHLAVYCVLMLWFLQIYRRPLAQLLIASGLWSTSMAIEVFQGFLPLRHFDFHDLVANTAGILLAVLLCRRGLAGMLGTIERRWLMAMS